MTTFTFNNTEYKTNETTYWARVIDAEAGTVERMKKADFEAIRAQYEESLKTQEDTNAEQNEPEAPVAEAPKKERKHPTADAFLAAIPKDTYIFRTNAKGHILISKAEGDKTAYARIRPLKDGAYIFPGKELKATRSDWEHHEGWANEYALKVANWDEVAEVLKLTPAEPENA